MADTEGPEEITMPKPKGLLIKRSKLNIRRGIQENKKAFDRMWSQSNKAAMFVKRVKKDGPRTKSGKPIIRTKRLIRKHVSNLLASHAGSYISKVVEKDGWDLRTGAVGETAVPAWYDLSDGFRNLLAQFLSAYCAEAFCNAVMIKDCFKNGQKKVTPAMMKLGVKQANDSILSGTGGHPGSIRVRVAKNKSSSKKKPARTERAPSGEDVAVGGAAESA